MRNLALLLSLAFAGAAVAACTSGGGTAGPDLCTIDESLFRDLEVAAGTEPQLAWCGAPARELTVQRTAGGGTTWAVSCADDETLCITPRVTYGDTIPGTTIDVAAQPLQAGQAYSFCLDGIDGRPPRACLDFTP